MTCGREVTGANEQSMVCTPCGVSSVMENPHKPGLEVRKMFCLLCFEKTKPDIISNHPKISVAFSSCCMGQFPYFQPSLFFQIAHYEIHPNCTSFLSEVFVSVLAVEF